MYWGSSGINQCLQKPSDSAAKSPFASSCWTCTWMSSPCPRAQPSGGLSKSCLVAPLAPFPLAPGTASVRLSLCSRDTARNTRWKTTLFSGSCWKIVSISSSQRLRKVLLTLCYAFYISSTCVPIRLAILVHFPLFLYKLFPFRSLFRNWQSLFYLWARLHLILKFEEN